MPNFDWQLIVVLLAVAGATAFIVRRGWKTFRRGAKKSGCGSCGSCPAPSATAAHSNAPSPLNTAFVPLESLSRTGCNVGQKHDGDSAPPSAT